MSSPFQISQPAVSTGSNTGVALAGTTSVSFTIPSSPKGKMRHQTIVWLRCGQCQRSIVGQRKECPYCQNRRLEFVRADESTPKEQREYEKFAAMCALQGMKGRNKFSGPVKVHCVFLFGIPKSRERKLQEGAYHTQRPDL